MAEERRLGVGFIGSGFITRFHIKSWVGRPRRGRARRLEPQPGHAEEAAALARSLRVGEARAFASIEEMVAAPEIDCIWICGPNHARIENMERIVDALWQGREARRHRLREAAGPQRRGSATHGRAGREGGSPARLSRETSSSRPGSSAAARSSGRAGRR